MEKHIILAGGSGFIGREIQAQLESKAYRTIILSRQKKPKNSNYVHWDPAKGEVDWHSLPEKFSIINLAGAGIVEKRWTDQRKEVLLKSRTESLDTLFSLCQNPKFSCEHIISSSAIGFYGNATDNLHEERKGDNSFLSETCQAWEKSAEQFGKLDIPQTIVRTGVVLGKDHGAFKEFTKSLPLGILGIPGDGSQILSWIHLKDIANMYIYLLENKIEGIFNGVAPQPSSMEKLFSEIKKHKKIWLTAKAPEFVLKIILGEMAVEVLKSSFVSSKKIEDAQFKFEFPSIESCIQDLLR